MYPSFIYTKKAEYENYDSRNSTWEISERYKKGKNGNEKKRNPQEVSLDARGRGRRGRT